MSFIYPYLFDIDTYLSVFHLYFEHHSMMKVCLHLVPVSGKVVHLHWSPARVAGEVLGLDAAQPGLEAEAGVRRGEGVGVVRQRRHGRQDRRPRKPRGGGGGGRGGGGVTPGGGGGASSGGDG